MKKFRFVSGPGGLLGAVEGLSYAVIVAGVAVLGFQVIQCTTSSQCIPHCGCRTWMPHSRHSGLIHAGHFGPCKVASFWMLNLGPCFFP